jgi:hypothetical protein
LAGLDAAIALRDRLGAIPNRPTPLDLVAPQFRAEFESLSAASCPD